MAARARVGMEVLGTVFFHIHVQRVVCMVVVIRFQHMNSQVPKLSCALGNAERANHAQRLP